MNSTPDNLRKEHSRRWEVAPVIPADLAQALDGYSPVLKQLLVNRGYRTSAEARQFLEARPPAGAEPLLMKGMPEAVERIWRAIQEGELIAVYGDYDADGVTATALLTLALTEAGGNAVSHIPNRFEEGYGLNKNDLEKLKDSGVRLVITVDCGIRSTDEAEFANQIGLELIITDHHHPGPELPRAIAVINPRQPGDPYPEKDLAGVGLAYKLAAALYGSESGEVERYLDLVAVGTVADLAPLSGENRSLVRRGLELLRRQERQGLVSLMAVANLAPARLNATHIGYSIGPRLNAAGRMTTAEKALELLTTWDVLKAGELAQVLDNQNRERQKLTQAIQEQAEIIAQADDPEGLLLFAASENFNHGVVGLAASRLSERYHRPAIVATIDEELTRGSCRSIPGFHITEALDQCEELLVKHGGHAAAAGFTVPNERLAELKRRLKALAQEALAGRDLRPVLKADLELPLADLKPAILEDLKALEPTGQSNPRAVFVSRNLRPTRVNTVGNEGQHLKLDVTDGRLWYPAIAFQQGHWAVEMPERIDIMYYYEVNEFNGRSTLQLNVIDLKPAGLGDT